MPTGFKIADAYVAVTLDRDPLRQDLAALPAQLDRDVNKAGTTVGRRMGQSVDKSLSTEVEKSGKNNGDKLSKGMEQAVIRNSPLIAAAVGGALAAGAPVAIAGATALFAGIGIAAATMNDEVQRHWSLAWQSIVTGTKQDATVLQQTVANMADQVAAGFSSIRPAMRLMFSDIQPMLEGFTGSLIKMAQNAMPGLVAAVHSAGPVMAGLGSLLENIGTGLSGFFQAISEHGAAAGKAFDAIGQIVAALLPILGDLLGQGAELASIVLPPLADALGVVADALHSIAPILPAVALGFGAFKIVQSITGPVSKLSDLLKGFPSASSALGSFQNALGPIGAAAGVMVTEFALWQQQIQSWGQALAQGGQQAAAASAEIQKLTEFGQVADSGFQGFIGHITGYGYALDAAKNSTADAAQAQKDYEATLPPVEQAQLAVTRAVDAYGPSSAQAAAAQRDYEAASAANAAQQNALQLAVHGVTDAMVAQANQALANASSQFAYQQATQQVADAQARLKDLQDSGTASTSDLNNATNSLNQAMLAQAQAAGRLAADSLPATATELDRNQASASATLQELYRLRDTMGSQFPAALQQAINGLERSGAATSGMSGQAYNATGVVQGLIGNLFNLGNQHPTPTVGVHDQATYTLRNIAGYVYAIPTTRTVTVNVIGKNVLASGGPVIKAASGKLVGPGTDTSDSIPAIGPGGARWALSNNEWVIRAAAAKHYGDATMAAINAGVAQVSIPADRLPVSAGVGSAGMSKVQGGAVGNTYNVTLNLHGWGGGDGAAFGRAALREIQQGLRKLDRETS